MLLIWCRPLLGPDGERLSITDLCQGLIKRIGGQRPKLLGCLTLLIGGHRATACYVVEGFLKESLLRSTRYMTRNSPRLEKRLLIRHGFDPAGGQ